MLGGMLKNLLTALRGTNEKTSADEAGRLVSMARDELGAARKKLIEAQEAYRVSRLAADAKATLAARDEKLHREVLVDRAEAAIELAEQRLVEAQARDAEKARIARYALAGAKNAAARKALAEYQQHAEAIRAIIRVVAEADAAIAAANSDLPTAAEPLLHPEQMLRGLPAEPAITLSTRTEPATWVFAEGVSDDVVPADLVKKIEVVGQEAAIRYGRIVEFQHGVRVERRVIGRPGKRIRTVLPGVSAYRPESLAAGVTLPGFSPGDGPIWLPCGLTGWAGTPLGQDGPEVVATATDLAAAESAGDPRPPRQRTDGWEWIAWADEAAKPEVAA